MAQCNDTRNCGSNYYSILSIPLPTPIARFWRYTGPFLPGSPELNIPAVIVKGGVGVGVCVGEVVN